jgi:hypothetical protein
MTIDEMLEELVPPFEFRADGWNDVLDRSRRTRKRYALVAVALAALLLVPAGLALHRLFQGTPAPPSVQTWFAANNKRADEFVRNGFAARYPHANVSQAHGVLEVETSDGPEDLWVAPNDQGGQCSFIDFADDPPGSDGQYGFGGCYPSGGFDPSGIDWGPVWVEPHPTLQTLSGRLTVPATRVEVDLANGSTLHLPVVENFFLASLSRDDRVTEIRAYDNSGVPVATARPLARK